MELVLIWPHSCTASPAGTCTLGWLSLSLPWGAASWLDLGTQGWQGGEDEAMGSPFLPAAPFLSGSRYQGWGEKKVKGK